MESNLRSKPSNLEKARRILKRRIGEHSRVIDRLGSPAVKEAMAKDLRRMQAESAVARRHLAVLYDAIRMRTMTQAYKRAGNEARAMRRIAKQLTSDEDYRGGVLERGN